MAFSNSGNGVGEGSPVWNGAALAGAAGEGVVDDRRLAIVRDEGSSHGTSATSRYHQAVEDYREGHPRRPVGRVCPFGTSETRTAKIETKSASTVAPPARQRFHRTYPRKWPNPLHHPKPMQTRGPTPYATLCSQPHAGSAPFALGNPRTRALPAAGCSSTGTWRRSPWGAVTLADS